MTNAGKKKKRVTHRGREPHRRGNGYPPTALEDRLALLELFGEVAVRGWVGEPEAADAAAPSGGANKPRNAA